MDKTSLILSGLLGVAFVVMLAPNILAMNRGKVLRNIALWLAIFLGLGLIYQNFGPGHNPLMGLESLTGDKDNLDTPPIGEQPGSDQGYFPPKEE